jgi:flagellin
LSSGYKINRAADDAAGLSISEKMRKQIRGLTQASSNAEDGISAVQTAEGALSEVQDMLQRMNELAVKSANGTNSASDRSYIQDEIDQLTTEIDRVAQTTKFNETYLLKGNTGTSAKDYSINYKAATKPVEAVAEFNTGTAGSTVTVSFDNTEGDNSAVNELINSMKKQGVTVTTTAGKTLGSLELNGDAAANYKVVTTDSVGKFYQIKDLSNKLIAEVTIGFGDIDGSETLLTSKVAAQQSKTELQQFYDADGNAISANALDNYFSVGTDNSAYLKADAASLYDAVGTKIERSALVKYASDDLSAVKDQTVALNIKFQVGADTSSNNKIAINIDAMSAKGLGINGLKVSTTKTADAAVNTISEAIQKVSKQRSALGAIQNRLEHTINNLDNVVENTTSAESAIRDTDMATEMVKYSNANILSQAGQAMLAQSNQSNQGVLSLLG